MKTYRRRYKKPKPAIQRKLAEIPTRPRSEADDPQHDMTGWLTEEEKLAVKDVVKSGEPKP